MLTASRLLGGVVLIKAVDVVLRGPSALPTAGWAAVLALWVVGGCALLLGPATRARARTAWGAILVGGAGLAVDVPLELRRQHLFLLLGVALAGLVARDDGERLLLWRVQLTALYGVAALAKTNETFLGGDVLALTFATGPLAPLGPPGTGLLIACGVVLVAAEAGLAVALWLPRLRVAAVGVAAALHGGALVVASADPLVGLRLVVFGGAAVLLCAACAGLLQPG